MRLRQPEIDEVTKGKRRPDAEMPPIATTGKDLKGKDQKVPPRYGTYQSIHIYTILIHIVHSVGA